MVASRSDTKRRRRDSSPLDSNPKRTKVHAQRKFAQGVSSLSSLLNLTPVKEKSDKSRSSGLSGNSTNGSKGNNNSGSQSDVAVLGKRALPARGAKKPSIEDMITFLCYRGTSALPPHLAHLNKAPSPEPTSLSPQIATENSRSKLGDKTSRDNEKGNIKKPLKTAASSAQKAVTAAQALKRKYQEQRIKKTTVPTLSSKSQPVPLLRTTRSSAGTIATLSTKTNLKKTGKKADAAASPSRKKDSSAKDDATPKKSVRTPGGKQQSSSKTCTPITQASGSRGGLRSGGQLPENSLRSSIRKVGSNTPLKREKKQSTVASGDVSLDCKKLATSLSDFSSEDDQPLVKKHKPLVHVQKLIKKSIANIGRKMKLEPRRSKRGMPVSTSPARRLSGGSSQSPSSVTNRASGLKEEQKVGKKTAVSSKELNGIIQKSNSQDNQKKDSPVTLKPTSSKMKKGYVMELVTDRKEEIDPLVETRSRRGSRDSRDIATDDKASINSETKTKTPGADKKKDCAKSIDQSKKSVFSSVFTKAMNHKASTSLKSQGEISISAVLKSPPDLRIPPSIKRPLTAVGITNPMAIAAAAAVVFKPLPVKSDEKGKPKELIELKEKNEELKPNESSGQLNPHFKTSKSSKEDKIIGGQSKSRPGNTSDNKIPDVRKGVKMERTKAMSPRRKTGNSSDEDSRPILSIISKDVKKTRLQIDSDSHKEIITKDDNIKTPRASRKNTSKVPSEEDESGISSSQGGKATVAVKKNSDDDESKISSRARRSTNRSSRKLQSSDEEGPIDIQAGRKEGKAKRATQLYNKASSTENESEVDMNLTSNNKKQNSRQLKTQSSDDEISADKTNKSIKKLQRSLDEYSSENDESENETDTKFTASKPSTRSVVRTKVTERTPHFRSRRSGKKSPLPEDSLCLGGKNKTKSETNDYSSEDGSDSEEPPRIPKTRSKTVNTTHTKREINTESSGDETDEKSTPQKSRKIRNNKRGSPAPMNNEKSSRQAESSDESTSSSSQDRYDNTKPRRKTKATGSGSKAFPNKSKRTAQKVRNTSDEESDEGKEKVDEEKGIAGKTRRSRSPRRSSRRGVKARIQENEMDSSVSEGSSLESSPGQNRRVLRERRGFFSFAEVDPPSDSEEDVIAATKASLEMVSQQQSADIASSVELKKAEKVFQESDNASKQLVKHKSSEASKSNKKSKPEPSQQKKSLSKKRVKPPSEVQPNLNEELERTLLSINLSPQSKSIDKSPDNIISTKTSTSLVLTVKNSTATSASHQSSSVEAFPIGPTSPSYLTQHKAVPKHSSFASVSSPLTPGASPLLGSQSSVLSLSAAQLGVSELSVTTSQTDGLKSTSTKCAPATTKVQNPYVSTATVSLTLTSTSVKSTPVTSTSFLQSVPKSTSTSCGVIPVAASCSLPTLTTLSAGPVMSSVIGMPSTSMSASGQILAASLQAQMSVPIPTPLASGMPTSMSSSIPVSISSSVSAPLPAPMALPISAPMSIPLTTQLGIPLQTSVNVPLAVPMSGTMTLPLQVAPHSSGTSATAPFLLPMSSALTPMLAQGQTIIKKDSGTLGGMPNPVGNVPPLMVGMNHPLVVNSNRGAFFLSTGSAMTMASSQQQMVPGSLMPSLLSLRLPDKPAGQQTIMASSPLYVPFAFGNPGIIHTQGQMQPQIQTMTGVSTITAMATNIQNTVTTNMQNTVASNIQHSIAANMQSTISTNMQNALAANIQNAPAASIENPVATAIQTSVSSAMTLTQTQGSAGGIGMKRQLVLATKNGPVSKLILSVGEDGSHVLAAASPNSISTSETQTLMSVMQPIKPLGPVMNIAGSPGLQSAPSRPNQSSIAPKLAPMTLKGVQTLPSSTGALVASQQLIPSSCVPVISSGQGMVSNSSGGTPSLTPVTSLPIRPMPVTSLPSSALLQTVKSGASTVTVSSPGGITIVTSSPIISSSAAASVTKNSSLPNLAASSSAISNVTEVLSRSVASGALNAPPVSNAVVSSRAFTVTPNALPVSNAVVSSRAFTVTSSTLVKPELRPSTTSSTRPPASPAVTTSSSISLHPERLPTSFNLPTGSSSDSILSKTTSVPSSESSSSRPLILRPSTSVAPTGPPKYSTPVKVAAPPSPARSIGNPVDTKPPVPASVTVTPPIPTSRIPSAPAALAALKSPSGTPSTTRAVAKTGSSRKPYSTAPSYAVAKTTDSAAPTEVMSSSVSPVSSSQEPFVESSMPSPAAVRSTTSSLTPKVTVTTKGTSGAKPTVLSAPPLHIKSPAPPSVSSSSEQKRKGTEVELAPTHRTLSMLSTAFQGSMSKERKGAMAKRTNTSLETSNLSDKRPEQVNLEKSGLDSLAEIATSLAEQSAETTLSSDKRTPQHSLWTNPAQILGKETLKVPGLPITANIGVNLPTKNDLAKMKSGAVLADAVEKRTMTDLEKLTKVKGSSAGTDSEKSSVSGLLTSSKADTPRQKVQKWLDDGSKGDSEHKVNCSLLNNGNSCTCDVMEEDISNLNSLAEVCVSMERINSPVKDPKIAKQGSKLASEKKSRQDSIELSNKNCPSSPAKSSLPLNSHQMKVTWQNAFGVKSPSRSIKSTIPSQSKRNISAEDSKTGQTSVSEPPEKNQTSITDKSVQNRQEEPPFQKPEQCQSQNDGSGSYSFPDESSQGRKSTQRRSLLGRLTDHPHPKLDTNAFSADNESSVYAFEAEKDTPPVSQPYRRRSKTSSRSDEEDSTSIGSISNPVAVHVSKDPVIVPIQADTNEKSSLVGSAKIASEKNGIRTNASPNDGSDVYYIPLCGQEGNEDDIRAVAVRLGKEGPNNRVIMSAKLVKKPPTFKHPNDTNDDGLPNKRAKMDAFSVQSSNSSSTEPEASTSNAPTCTDAKTLSQGSANDSKIPQDRHKQNPRDLSRYSAADSSSEDTSSLINMPTSSKGTRESQNSMSPSSSRNRSPMSDKTSPPASQNNKKCHGRLNRQSSIDSDASDKAKSMGRGSKSKSASSRASPSPSLPSTSSTSSGPSRPSQKSNRSYNGPVPGNVSEAPVFHPSEKEFQDPYAYIEKIRPIAEKYGLCRIVAPPNFKPDCNVEDDIRFMADNQYVHKMMDRWGPNAKEMRAIIKYIAQHNIHLKHAPLVGGMELDLPRLYTTVQNFGGLMEVMDKKRWVKVAETMRIPKSAQDRASKLDEVYCKCLLPYETLKTGERDNLFEMVEVEWEMRKERRDKRLAASASPADQSESTSQQDDEDDDEEEEEEDDEEEDECIVKGRSMPLTTFYRTARNTTHMWFKSSSPSASEVEHEFWRHVRDRNFHICVNAGSVDCSDPPYGFPIRNSPFAKHPWNLKVFSNNSGSVLRSLGSVIGVTVPTLHFGMVFTTCCWYRDPHGLPWIEYLHTGAKKIWYGIPEHGGEKFRLAMQEVAPHYVRKKALWLASDTAMVPPSMLTERKVPLCRTVQEPGQFIVVFPRAHTSSVATGYIVSESVSFAAPRWLNTAMDSFKEMQKCNEPPLFSLDKLIFSIAEDPRTSLSVLNMILPSAMEILEREITCQQELKKKGINTSERLERTKKKSSSKKAKVQKEAEDMELMECEVCSTNLYLSVILNSEDDTGYCLVHASQYLDQDKLDPTQCKLLYTYSQNELHEFCQNLLDRIEAKSRKKGNNFSSNNSDSGSSASTSTRN